MDNHGDKIRRLITLNKVLDHFRTVHDEFPPQLMQLVNEIAIAPNSTMTRLTQRTNMSLPQISRHVERLGRRWGGRAGHELAYAVENPENRREKLVKLSPKGERFVQTLVELLTQ
jgi:DNA-binding MarR family transcriptional regulator